MLTLLLALQQSPAALPSGSTASAPATIAATTPPTRDTAGYWQQRVRYRIAARLDEGRERLVARGTLVYVNRSPDTLRELWVHQYLNAFRPGSRWSATDEREGRERFQRLREPAYGYERFTAAPTIDGVAVTAEYPLAPDSTVVRLALPRPLAPGDSLTVAFAWEARPSTTPRRQGRRGRSWDFSQWFPKVAVYDRLGWEPKPLTPAGEFYGEFGDYDVTLVVRKDQVIGATGVPVSGDPGWSGALRGGAVRTAADWYGPVSPALDDLAPDSNEKAVRWIARDVHHFAFSLSPDYRYEGGVYLRPAERRAPVWWPTWDTIPIHILYRPGDEAQWGNGQAVARTVAALGWLERTYGPYAYPQMTNLHRLDGGGTEFPMMMMNGSASQGLILHEGGHIFTFGILANNEWRSGWMDEGLTSYQTSWAQGLTRIERARGEIPLTGERLSRAPSPVIAASLGARYRLLALRPTGADVPALDQWRLALLGRAEPIGTPADRFREFGIYNAMIYGRAESMYGQLRDAVGDSAFTRFLRGYYARWGLRHVDEAAMRAEAERASGMELGWFFDQWVHRVGLTDYALTDVERRRSGDQWVTRARVQRRGDYRHPMPVGVRTAAGWTIVRADAFEADQTVHIVTRERPLEVRLDPERVTEDWYRPNDVERPRGRAGTATRPDWPFLDQRLADRRVRLLSPLAWWSEAGGLALGLRARGNYQGLVDRTDLGLAVYARPLPPYLDCAASSASDCRRNGAEAVLARTQFYMTAENPRLRLAAPAMGLRLGFWHLDGVDKVEALKAWDASPFLLARGPRLERTARVTFTSPFDRAFQDPERWSGRWVADAGLGTSWSTTISRSGEERRILARGELTGGFQDDGSGRGGVDRFARLEAELAQVLRSPAGRWVTSMRTFGGFASQGTPRERQVYAGSRNPTATFGNHLVRPYRGLLARPDVPFLAAGGAGMRGYDARVVTDRVISANLEQAVALRRLASDPQGLRLWATAFADHALLIQAGSSRTLSDAGVGLAFRGRLFDRDLRLRADVPFWVSEPAFAIDGRGDRTTRVRFGFALNDVF